MGSWKSIGVTVVWLAGKYVFMEKVSPELALKDSRIYSQGHCE
jgi:hypothetical protein